MLIIIKEDYDAMSNEAAQIVADRLRRKPDMVLGLATGTSPLGMYSALIEMHKQRGLDFSKVTTFNLDEYVGLPPTHEYSYRYFMDVNLFNHVNIPQRHIYMPDGMADDIDAHCEWYEQQIQRAGGIDLQILGIGGNGHIAFNEPGSSLGSRTRVKTLTDMTRWDNSRFFVRSEDVPKYALTMGVGSIMDSKELLLLASGKGKAAGIAAATEGPITAQVPASVIQLHRKAFLILDKEAASELSGRYPDTWRSSFTLES